ncbi:MAG: HAMP domain-containing histidine kinase [Candidatus Coatesbacteria bacterium]|nr:MAG: HAMP domain-containing histidine kinase [Candidatus Coatesbacteria bacterium]
MEKTTINPETPAKANDDNETARLYALMNMLAHEIRNPLNALVMNLKLLGDRVTDDKGRKILHAATVQADRTNEILNDFLRFARPRKPDPSSFNVLETLENIRTFVAPRLKQEGIKLEINTGGEPPELFTDSDMLAQILLNLILNSIDAAPKGKIRIDVEKDAGITKIIVRDDGPGFIEPGRALEPFYSTKDDGVGLGLATVGSLVSALGGTVKVGNAPGNGALVELEVPDFNETKAKDSR